MTIGQKIKMLRREAGWTQRELADKLCISSQAVSKWETDSSYPDISMVGPLTKAFGVSANEILCLDEEEDN